MTKTKKRSKSRTASKGQDKRKHCRYPCTLGDRMRLAIRPEFRGRDAKPINLSAGGIGFLLPEALKTGTVVVFELYVPNGGLPLSRLARVRHCRPHDVPADAPWLPATPGVVRVFRHLLGMPSRQAESQAWLIGCEFERPLSDEELAYLRLNFNGPS